MVALTETKEEHFLAVKMVTSYLQWLHFRPLWDYHVEKSNSWLGQESGTQADVLSTYIVDEVKPSKTWRVSKARKSKNGILNLPNIQGRGRAKEYWGPVQAEGGELQKPRRKRQWWDNSGHWQNRLIFRVCLEVQDVLRSSIPERATVCRM